MSAVGHTDDDGVAIFDNPFRLSGGTITEKGNSSVSARVGQAEPSGYPRTAANAQHKTRGVSNDAKLSALALSGATLSPAFTSDTLEYTAGVANSVASTTVTYTANPTSAAVTITPTDADLVAAGHQINLAEGVNTITVEVAVGSTYTITVTRAAAPVVTLILSADSVAEDSGTAVSVTATVSPAHAAAFTVTVSASPATASAYTLTSNTTLSFAPNATDSTGTVTITPVGNGDNGVDKVITVSGTVAGVTGVDGPADVTLTITDDDHPVVTHILTLHQNDQDRTALDPANVPEDVGQVCLRITAATEANLPPEKDGGILVETVADSATVCWERLCYLMALSDTMKTEHITRSNHGSRAAAKRTAGLRACGPLLT